MNRQDKILKIGHKTYWSIVFVHTMFTFLRKTFNLRYDRTVTNPSITLPNVTSFVSFPEKPPSGRTAADKQVNAPDGKSDGRRKWWNWRAWRIFRLVCHSHIPGSGRGSGEYPRPKTPTGYLLAWQKERTQRINNFIFRLTTASKHVATDGHGLTLPRIEERRKTVRARCWAGRTFWHGNKNRQTRKTLCTYSDLKSSRSLWQL